MIDAIILAGRQEIKGVNYDDNKALLCINGKMMVEYVVDALKNADGVDRIAVVGPGDKLKEALSGKVDAVINADGSLIENLITGVRYMGLDRDLLVCTSDIPFITSQAISDFIHRSQEMDADFCYPIVEKGLNEKKFPEMERTYIKTRDGVFTGGNIFYVNPRVIESRLEIIKRLVAARKNPFKMARIFSISFMLQLVAGRLTISRAEDVVSKVAKMKARAVISRFPEICSDVDKPGDVVVAASYLTK